jgi:hypothetical protein
MSRFAIILLLIFTIHFSFSQTIDEETKDKPKADLIPSFSAFYAYELSGGDLITRFGNNHKVGASLSLKFRNNWLISLEAGYMDKN